MLAQDPAGLVDEAKVGLLAHDVTLFGRHAEGGLDIDAELLFKSPSLLAPIGAPRPVLGGWINSGGNTDAVYGGLTWGLPIVPAIAGRSDALTLYGTLGGSFNNGEADRIVAGRKRLGSPLLFYLAAELGYQVTPAISVSVIVNHISNADLASHNDGITNFGARLGIKF